MDGYLTLTEACIHFRRSRNTLLAMIADGRLEATDVRRPGGKYAKWLIKPHSLRSMADLKYQEFKKRAGI